MEGDWTYTDDGGVGGGDGDPSGGDQSFPQDCENDVTTPCPGDFATDWILFLEINYGKNEEGISDAEHKAMAVKYHNIIVDGLKEFFDLNFTQSDYEAMHGLD